MATYKVPQDVEAEDKLLGPLSFRQFIYMMIAMFSAAVAFFMFQVFPLLVLVPLPIIILFGALALPLRKDQPMETYLLALLRFYLKPKIRLWNPDGTITYVEITAPRLVEERLSKDFTGETAKERLDYLARVMDSRGWALKGVAEQDATFKPTVTQEAQHAFDIMDDKADLSKSFDNLIAKKDQERREEALAQMRDARQDTPPEPPTPTSSRRHHKKDEDELQATHTPGFVVPEDLKFNPYPTAMHQKVVRPLGSVLPGSRAIGGLKPPASRPTELPTRGAIKPADKKTDAKPPETPASAMPEQVSPDIIMLSRTTDLSISALAHEAHRLENKNDEEVVIKLH